MNEEEIRARASRINWFHNFELIPGVFTNGHAPTREEDRGALFHIPLDLSGKRVLDIGCADGYFTFLAETRGANVVAIDAWPQQGFFFAHEVRGSKAEFHRMDIYDLQPDTFGAFDIVFFMGVYYHLKNPILALERIASVTREMAIIESQIIDLEPGQGEAFSRFYEHDDLAPGDPTNWWAPNVPCLLQTVRAAGFPRAELITRYNGNGRAVVHAYKGPRTAEKMLTEDFICVIQIPQTYAEVSGTVRVSGLALSKLEPEGGIERLTVYLDELDVPSAELGQAQRGVWYPEVAARVGDQYGPVGFTFDWDTTGIRPGRHTLYVLAEGQRGWHYAAKSVIVKGQSLGKSFTNVLTKVIRNNTTNEAELSSEMVNITNSPKEQTFSLSFHSLVATVEQAGGSLDICLPIQPSWPLADNIRRAFHHLVIYYVNILAKKQKIFNQGITSILKRLIESLERTKPDIEALQVEVATLRAKVQTLQTKIEK